MNLEDTIDVLPGSLVYLTKNSKQYGNPYAKALVNPLDVDKPYQVLRMDTVTHTLGEGNDSTLVVERANLYLKAYPGTRFDPINFFILEE